MGRSRNAAADSESQARIAKEKGNAAFARQSYTEAVRWFAAAIENDAENAILYSNRSAALLMMGQADRALADANKALELSPSWGKACYRKGVAHSALKQYDTACATFTLGSRLEPDNPEFKRLWEESAACLISQQRDSMKWERFEARGAPPNRKGHTAVIIRRKAIIFGSPDPMYMLDLDTLVWIPVTGWGDVPPSMDGHTATALDDGRMLVFGGRQDAQLRRGVDLPPPRSRTGLGNSVYTLNVDNMEWKYKECTGQVPSPRWYHTSVKVGKEIWVFGGIDQDVKCLNDVHVLNMEAMEWRKVDTPGSSATPSFRHTATPLPRTPALLKRCFQDETPDSDQDGALILIFGGLHVTGDSEEPIEHVCHILDTATCRWGILEGDDAPASRIGHTLTSIGRIAILFGGKVDSDWTSSDVMLLDCETALWSTHKSSGAIPPPRDGHCTVIVGLELIKSVALLRKMQRDGTAATPTSATTTTAPQPTSTVVNMEARRRVYRAGLGRSHSVAPPPTNPVQYSNPFRGAQMVILGGSSPARGGARFAELHALDLGPLFLLDVPGSAEMLGENGSASTLDINAVMPNSLEYTFKVGDECKDSSLPREISMWRRRELQHWELNLSRKLEASVRWRRSWKENWRNRLVVSAPDKDTSTLDIVDALAAVRKRKHAIDERSDVDVDLIDDEPDVKPSREVTPINDSEPVAEPSPALIAAANMSFVTEGASSSDVVAKWSEIVGSHEQSSSQKLLESKATEAMGSLFSLMNVKKDNIEDDTVNRSPHLFYRYACRAIGRLLHMEPPELIPRRQLARLLHTSNRYIQSIFSHYKSMKPGEDHDDKVNDIETMAAQAESQLKHQVKIHAQARMAKHINRWLRFTEADSDVSSVESLSDDESDDSVSDSHHARVPSSLLQAARGRGRRHSHEYDDSEPLTCTPSSPPRPSDHFADVDDIAIFMRGMPSAIRLSIARIKEQEIKDVISVACPHYRVALHRALAAVTPFLEDGQYLTMASALNDALALGKRCFAFVPHALTCKVCQSGEKVDVEIEEMLPNGAEIGALSTVVFAMIYVRARAVQNAAGNVDHREKRKDTPKKPPKPQSPMSSSRPSRRRVEESSSSDEADSEDQDESSSSEDEESDEEDAVEQGTVPAAPQQVDDEGGWQVPTRRRHRPRQQAEPQPPSCVFPRCENRAFRKNFCRRHLPRPPPQRAYFPSRSPRNPLARAPAQRSPPAPQPAVSRPSPEQGKSAWEMGAPQSVRSSQPTNMWFPTPSIPIPEPHTQPQPPLIGTQSAPVTWTLFPSTGDMTPLIPLPEPQIGEDEDDDLVQNVVDMLQL